MKKTKSDIILKILKNFSKIISFIIRELWGLDKKKSIKSLLVTKKVLFLQSQNGRREAIREGSGEIRLGERDDL